MEGCNSYFFVCGCCTYLVSTRSTVLLYFFDEPICLCIFLVDVAAKFRVGRFGIGYVESQSQDGIFN